MPARSAASPDRPGPDAPEVDLAARVHDALACLHDPPALESHPLARLAAASRNADRDRRATPGQALRRSLLDAVDALQPARAAGPRAGRAHRLLTRRYLDGAPIAAVQRELAVSRSEYYRAHSRAVEAIAAVLRERWGLTDRPASRPRGAEHDLTDDRADWPARSNLPAPMNSFVGREEQIEMVRQRLRDPEVRLLTLTGAGGVGKTRLALRVAADLLEEFPDGVHLVALEPIVDAGLVLATIAQTLGLRATGRPRSLAELLADALRDRRVLLVLDNVEHLLSAVARVGDLLAACPRLKVLATSREPLHLYAEHALAVPPLTLPPAAARAEDEAEPGSRLAALAACEAIRLFVERARAVRPDFALTNENVTAVAEICGRLDGLPLAIELAAARSGLLPPPALLARLQDRPGLLTGVARDLPIRHRTLRAAIDWSHDLLDDEEKALFRRLSVFAGGCTLDAAEAVCADDAVDRPSSGDAQSASAGTIVVGRAAVLDLLAALVSKSLLRADGGSPEDPRFAMLETIRAYAAERLDRSGEADRLRAAHAAHFLALAERAEPELRGRWQASWLDRLEREHDNLRTALRWLVGSGDAERGSGLAAALRRFWWVRGHTAEGRAWSERLIALSRTRPAALARSLATAALLAYAEGDHEAAEPLAAESLPLWRRLDDRPGLAESLHVLGHVALDGRRQYEAARDLFAESAGHYRAVGAAWGLAWSLNCLGTTARQVGDDDGARRAYDESLDLFRACGDGDFVAHVLGNLGLLLSDQGDRERGRALLDESVTRFRELGDRLYLAQELHRRGDLACEEGDHQTALRSYRECLTVAAELGARPHVAYALEGFAMLAGAQAQSERALRLAGAAAAVRTTIGQPRRASERARLERVLDAARAALGRSAGDCWSEGRLMTMEQAIAEAMAGAARNPRSRL